MIIFLVVTLFLVCSDAGPTHQTGQKGFRPLTDDDFARARSLDQKYLSRGKNGTFSCSSVHIRSRGTMDIDNKWPGARVPYTVSDQFDDNARAVIARAVQRYRDTTCVRFEPAQDGDQNYVDMQPGEGCNSALGMTGGAQTLNLDPDGCVFVGTAEHEMMHALGFDHEHQRPDRDEYIRVLWENIQEQYKFAYKKYGEGEMLTMGEPYDYGSIMHYPSVSSFSINWQPTMQKLQQGGPELGSAEDFSEEDIRKINKLYCNGQGGGGGGGIGGGGNSDYGNGGGGNPDYGNGGGGPDYGNGGGQPDYGNGGGGADYGGNGLGGGDYYG